jgi:micrococcal nuclease
VDGDTVDVDIDGKTERIRLIGLDTPETVDPRTTVQCFGQEASTQAHTLLDGKKVTLEADATQGERDTYGRLLRYIFIEDGTDFSKTMIENGYGHEYTYQVPYKRQNEYKEAQKQAESGKKGLWAANTCAGTTTAVTPVPAAAATTPSKSTTTPAPKTTAPAQTGTNCVIKGNISSGGKIYHVPGGAYYEKTDIYTSAGERWFCSEAEAVAAGWRKSLK